MPTFYKPLESTSGVVETPKPAPLWYRVGPLIYIDDTAITWIDRVGPYVRFNIDDANGEALREGPYIRLEELDI